MVVVLRLVSHHGYCCCCCCWDCCSCGGSCGCLLLLLLCLLLCIHTLNTCRRTPTCAQNCSTSDSSCFCIRHPTRSAKASICSFCSGVNLVRNRFRRACCPCAAAACADGGPRSSLDDSVVVPPLPLGVPWYGNGGA
uniref:Secreted protein n=1 Tax=Arundo donax TaxID=35708 RepID=A0A0A9F2P2_ARUDO